MSSHRPLIAAVLAGALLVPAGATAATSPSGGSGPSVEHLPFLRGPAESPVAVHGSSPKAIQRTGERMSRSEGLLRARVSTGADAGVPVRLTCPTGFVVGYGYAGPDAMELNGRPLLGRHSVAPKVQAAADRNGDGRFTGIVYALCSAVR